MANFKMDGIDEVIGQLDRLGNLDEVAPKMIDAAKPTVADCLRKNIRAAADRGYATGELADSVEAMKTRINQYGYFAPVLVTGMDDKGVRNGEKLAYLEYGTSTQRAHPVMKKTLEESREKAVQKMQDVFGAELLRNMGG